MSNIPGESDIGEYSDQELCEAFEMGLIALFKYPDTNIPMISASLILHDVYTRLAKHNNLKFGSMEEIYENFLKQKDNLPILKREEK